MKNSLFCISLFAMTFVLSPMDAPPIQLLKKTKRNDNAAKLLFRKEYEIGNHMDCLAFLDDNHLIVGEPSKSMIVNVLTNETMYFKVPANHVVSYPEQKLIVVTNSQGVGIYQISLDNDQEKIREVATKKNTKKKIFAGRSFLICGGKNLVTVENENKIKIYPYENGEIGKSSVSKKVAGIKLYTGPSQLSESLFFYQEQTGSCNNISVAHVENKKLFGVTKTKNKEILTTVIITTPNDIMHTIKQLVVGLETKSIAFLQGIDCLVYKGDNLTRPVCMMSQLHQHQFAVRFYTDILLARLILPDSPFMPDYRTLKIEFCDIDTRRIVSSRVITSVPKEGLWYTENPSGLWGNPSEIVFSPDGLKCAVLWNNSVYVSTVPTKKLLKKSPQFRTAFIRKMSTIYCIALPNELLSHIVRFLLSFYLTHTT